MGTHIRPNQAKSSRLKTTMRRDQRLGLSLVFRMVETNKVKQSRTLKALRRFRIFQSMRIMLASNNLIMFHLDDNHRPTSPSILPPRTPQAWPQALAFSPWMSLLKKRAVCRMILYSFLASLSRRGPRKFFGQIHLRFRSTSLSKPRTLSLLSHLPIQPAQSS